MYAPGGGDSAMGPAPRCAQGMRRDTRANSALTHHPQSVPNVYALTVMLPVRPGAKSRPRPAGVRRGAPLDPHAVRIRHF